MKYAARSLRKSPGFTTAAVLTLALGIGGATAIFSIADAVVLRPLPYADSDRLVVIWQTDRDRNQPFVEISYPAYREWRDRSRLFQSLAAMSSVNDEVVLTGRGDPMAVEGRGVTGDFFTVLGVAPAFGRGLRLEDERAGAPDVIVVSHQFWRDRLSASRAVVGDAITLDGKPRTIVGVMPPGFAYPKGAEYWAPVGPAAGPLVEDRGLFWMVGLGRLQHGVTLDAARNELTGIWRQTHSPFFKADAYSSSLTPLADSIFGPTRLAMFGLLGAVGLLLVMACANVAGLLLVRATRQYSDMMTRQALGASRKRLACEALGETSLLALAGGAAGFLVAVVATPLVVALTPRDVPRLEFVAVNARAFGVAAAISALVAFVSALAPISLVGRRSLTELPRRSTQRVIAGRTRMGGALVIAEVAIAVIVLVAAGLVGRSFVKLRQAPLGFVSDRLLTVRITPKGERYEDSVRVSAFYQELLQRVRNQPGVESAGAVTIRPLWSTVGYDWSFTVEGQSEQDSLRNPLVNLMAVSADYFHTMGIPLRDGRLFTDRDAQGQPGVVVIGESLAGRIWPGQNAIGKRLMIPMGDSPYHKAWLTVVGVVGDARYRELQATRLDFYLSHLQANTPLGYLVVRTTGEPTAVTPGIRAIVRELDSSVPVTEVASMDQNRGSGARQSEIHGECPRGVRLRRPCAGGAWRVRAAGVFGDLPHSGDRRADGARRGSARRAVDRSRQHSTPDARGHHHRSRLGGHAGAPAQRVVVRHRGVDPVTFAIAPIALALTALLASLAPALRAVRVDPLVALRYE